MDAGVVLHPPEVTAKALHGHPARNPYGPTIEAFMGRIGMVLSQEAP
jgi:hypothetical protein